MTTQEEIKELKSQLSVLKKLRNEDNWDNTTRRISNIKSQISILKNRL